MRTIQLFFFLLLSLRSVSNIIHEDLDWSGGGTCKITETKANLKLGANAAEIVFTFKFKDGCSKAPINMSINSKADYKEIKTTVEGKYKCQVKSGKNIFSFDSELCGNITSDTLIIVQKTTTYITVEFVEPQIYTFKPVIYLYPEKETKVNLKFDYNGELEFTYPEYPVTGWDVNAFPDGTLEIENKKYNYLFWDGKMNVKLFDFEKGEGSIIKSSELVSFFENTLTDIGLNTKEIQDFITFWAPKMMSNEQNYIHFLFTTDYDQVSTINVKPRPDNMLRLYMIWSDATGIENIELTEQMLPEFKRKGFSLVEWGGSEIPNLLNDF